MIGNNVYKYEKYDYVSSRDLDYCLYNTQGEFYDNLIRKLDLFDMSFYKYLFEPDIMFKGNSYARNGNVEMYEVNGNTYSTIVHGTKDYHVSIRFKGKSDEIDEATCDCPYYSNNKDNNMCKHIYALLLIIKTKDNHIKLDKYIHEYIDECNDIIKYSIKFMGHNKNYIDDDIKDEYNTCLDQMNYIMRTINIFFDKSNSENRDIIILRDFVKKVLFFKLNMGLICSGIIQKKVNEYITKYHKKSDGYLNYSFDDLCSIGLSKEEIKAINDDYGEDI